MKTKYETVEFYKKGDDWRCHDKNDGEEMGYAYRGDTTKQWYYAGKGVGHTVAQLTDIAHFLRQLNEEEK